MMIERALFLACFLAVGGCTGGLLLENASYREVRNAETMAPISVWKHDIEPGVRVCFEYRGARAGVIKEAGKYNWYELNSAASGKCDSPGGESVDWSASRAGDITIPLADGEALIESDVRRPFFWVYPLVPLGYAVDVVAFPVIGLSWAADFFARDLLTERKTVVMSFSLRSIHLVQFRYTQVELSRLTAL